MERTLRLTREFNGNRYHLIRDCVQQQKPFAIYNFTSNQQYESFLRDLDVYGKLNYVMQTITSLAKVERQIRIVYPSIFVTNEGTEVQLDQFKEIVKGSLKFYNLDSVVCLYDGRVSVFYQNGSHHSLGNTLYASSQMYEFNSDFYQIESMYYTFISS